MNYEEELKSGCVFHASTNTNLQVIYPNRSGSYENKSLVFAARHPHIAAIFLHDFGKDTTCRISVVNNVLTLIEQYVGAFETRYQEEPGAIYILPATYFLWAKKHFPHPNPDKHRWAEDYVAEFPVRPFEKIYIPNVRSYIRELINTGLIGFEPHTEGKTLEQRLAESYSPDSKDYQNLYELLSSPARIKEEINYRQQARD
ncbi:hypothetical protein P9G84_31070 [Brevibacillus centrosporus]|uniref:hypothetical protein n=1 Tax=Brevibacillus centrosporus TaxID=54910 RepID=UPI0011451734